jgi:hypothetical protein
VKNARRNRWRRRLERGDEAELNKWVEQSGLECVARVAAALTDVDGERGSPDKLDSLLLLKMAHLKRQNPDCTIHSVATEVSAAAHSHRKRGGLASMTTKLERDFKRNRHTWAILSETVPTPSNKQIAGDLGKPKSNNEFRARARILDILPSRIDIYDCVLAEAEGAGNDKLDLVRKVGRRRVEQLVVKAAANPFPLQDPRRKGKMPRGFLDLIEPDLDESAAKRRIVRR